MKPLRDQGQAKLIEWTLPMQPKETRYKLIMELNCPRELKTPHIITRRNFVKRTSTALTAFALGAAGLIPNTAKATPPVWTTIPNQLWRVGEPIFLDLSEFVTDADGDALSFSLDLVLPPGITITGNILSGVPTSDFPPTEYTVTADDGTLDHVPKPPTGLTVS